MRHRKTLVTLIVLIGLILVYQYPFQKCLALKKFRQYIQQQAVDLSQITRRESIKDWKNGGYIIRVNYADDKNHTYYYHYQVWTHKKAEALKFNQMTLTVIDEQHAVQLEAPYAGKVKYPPLDD